MITGKNMNQNGRLKQIKLLLFVHYLSSEESDKLNDFHKENFIRIDSVYYLGY